MTTFKKLSLLAKACDLLVKSVILLDQVQRTHGDTALDSITRSIKNLIETIQVHIDVAIAQSGPGRG